MAQNEMFESAVRAAGDLAGVFEYDGETGYFYLYEMEGEDGQKVLGSIHVLSGEPDFLEEDIGIQWDAQNKKVGLFIQNMLWAVFDEGGAQYGGSYRPGATPQLPSGVRTWFDTAM